MSLLLYHWIVDNNDCFVLIKYLFVSRFISGYSPHEIIWEIVFLLWVVIRKFRRRPLLRHSSTAIGIGVIGVIKVCVCVCVFMASNACLCNHTKN